MREQYLRRDALFDLPDTHLALAATGHQAARVARDRQRRHALFVLVYYLEHLAARLRVESAHLQT